MRRLTRVRLLLWAAVFALYALTTARDVLPADSGEFQVAAAGWGILHPPGYPLYTMVSGVWVRLIGLGPLPFRLNLLSAALAATTLLLLMDAVRCWTEGWGMTRTAARVGGLSAVLLLGTAPTFWAQATTANIRMPTLLFVTWGFLTLAHYQAPARESSDVGTHPALVRLGLIVGLGVGHHPSLIFVAAGWGLYLLLIDPSLLWQPRRWWKALPVTALAWLLPQLYIPLRGSMDHVPLAGESLDTWRGFWFHVLAQGFAGDMFAFVKITDLTLRLPLLKTLFGLQFPLWTLLGVGVAWSWQLARRWRFATALMTSWAIHTFITITYRAPQTVEYLMPAYVPMALSFGIGMAALWQWVTRRKPTAVRRAAWILPLALLVRLPLQVDDFMTAALDRSVRERVAPLLEQAPPHALILADWRWATPMWVLQETEGLGADVEVTYVYPVAGMDYEEVWRKRVEAAGDRPVYVTHNYEWPDWERAPVGGGYQLFRRPLETLPETLDFTPANADLGPVRLLGYRMWGDRQPGSPLEVHLAWQAIGPQTPAPSFTIRLFDGYGTFLTNADQFLDSDTEPGEVRFTEITLALPLAQCYPESVLRVGTYTVEDGAFNNLGEVALTQLMPDCTYPRLPTEHTHPGFIWGRGPFLRGVDYEMRDDAVTVYLHLCGPGEALLIRGGEREIGVERLGPGQCRTVAVPALLGARGRPLLYFVRPDGEGAQLVTLPLPKPEPTDRYVPLGNTMILVGTELTQRGDRYVLNLRWRSMRPLMDDLAVSARLLDASGNTLGVHDTQPALGALPTLKWVVRNTRVLDPHPFGPLVSEPTQANVVAYERFRNTPLSVSLGPNAPFTLR